MDKLYLVFSICFYGEQGWDSWCKCATRDIDVAVNKANEKLAQERNGDSFYKDRKGVCILPINDGDEACIYEDDDYLSEGEPTPYVLHTVNSNELFTVDEVEEKSKGE